MAPVAGPGGGMGQQAYRRLEHLLVTLALAPGALVQESVLCERLQIGRTPVREAVQRMAGHGLLRVLPRKGLLVAPVLRSELNQVLETRRVLERLLVVKASERASIDQRGALELLAASLERARHDLQAFLRLDYRLDELLAAAGGNTFLVRALEPLHIHCRRCWFLRQSSLDAAQAAGLHAALARAVAAQDGSGAIRALNGIIGAMEELVGGLDALS
ncbi:MAG: FCD domain-containing protein [Xanthomonadales bacterium]|nr:FCD domain-containing protein [Xanthomonadales bacterium]NIN58483.1 FCD domain-containing protein [Xanthomonadales bacterium]NIN76035.1 FCD domain-containing protein [Xanthomonadales bacterium]NIO13671.1 FCD domain-containing protein [Xanthomonadales bacterium]NIP10876.1 FCD domain-containing protein [Xanthomonadales bacterium]